MIDVLIAGQRDPEILAELAKGRMRHKIPQLRDALVGRSVTVKSLALAGTARAF